MSIKHWMAAALALTAPAWALSPDGKPDPLRSVEDSELGIDLSGRTRSQYLRSAISGDSVRLGDPTRENAAFTEADISLVGRPSASTRGTAIFRIHQDWSNYYEEGPNPINTRWLSFDGSILEDRLRFSVGDFRKRLSPLLVHAAEPELLLEPEIFANRRRIAMSEWFLGDNRIPLQGLDAEMAFNPLSSLRLDVGALGARLRSADNGSTTWLHHTGNTEKYTGALHARATLFKGLELGATHLRIYDRVAATRARLNAYQLAYKGRVAMEGKFYEDIAVNDGSLGLDVGAFLGSRAVTLKLGAEMALSSYSSRRDVLDTVGTYKQVTENAQGIRDTVDTPIRSLRLEDLETVDGRALSASLRAGFAPEEGLFGISLDVAYLRNDKNYVNDLAQTPTFGMRRILNSKSGVGGALSGYSTLDALYNHVYTVDPITNLSTSEYWGLIPDERKNYKYNGTNNWYRAAQFKNAYTNSTATRVERASMGQAGELGSPLDPHVQLIFPFGPATPNRNGINASLTASALERKIEATVLFASLKEVEGEAMDSLTAVPADYARLGGGLSARVNEFVGLQNRVELSGSWVRDSRKRGAFASKGVTVAATDFKSAMLNAGAYAGVTSRVALLAGYQQIKSNPVVDADLAAGALTFVEGDLTQSQWAAGLELKLTHGAYVTAEYGKLDVKEAKSGESFSQDVSSLSLLLAF